MSENQRKDQPEKREALLGHLTAQMPQREAASPCPDESLLAAVAEGKIRGVQRDEIFNHLADCNACRESYSLLRHLIIETPGRVRVFRPMALAASLVLVLLTVYVLYNSGALRRHEAQGQAPATFSMDEKEPLAESQPLRARPESAKSGTQALPPGEKKRKGRQNAPVGAVRHDTIARDSIKKPLVAPAEPKAMKKKERLPMAEETTTASFRTTAPAPAKSRMRPVSVASDSLVEKQKKQTLVPGISPARPPVGTAPGRIHITLFLSAENRVSEINFDPVASPLIPPLRRAFLAWNPSKAHRHGYLRFTASWNGIEWKIQPSSTSGGKPPGAPGT